MIRKISDILFLCSPSLCFNVNEVDGGWEVVHYSPFAQKDLFAALLGEDVSVSHKLQVDAFDPVTIEGGNPDGTVNGVLAAFHQFLTTNLKALDVDFEPFTVSLSADGVVSTSHPLFIKTQEENVLPRTINGLLDMFCFRFPTHQALEKLTEGFTKFVTPNYFDLFIETAVGSFQRNEMLGSYDLISPTIQGFLLSSSTQNEGCNCQEDCDCQGDCDCDSIDSPQPETEA